MRDTKEPDWKVPRRVRPLAQERFYVGVFAEIDRVSHDTGRNLVRQPGLLRKSLSRLLGVCAIQFHL